MSKYYSKLIQINENLDKELMEKGIVNSEINANDTVVKNDKVDLVKEDDGDGNTIEISTDSLTDDQKKEILLDKGVDQKALDNLKDPKELDGALSATLNNAEVKKESDEEADISEEVVIRMDDDDLDMHGYLKSDDGLTKGELEWTDDIKAAKVFQHEEMGQNAIDAICNRFHYDPSTFKTISLDPRADEPYEDSDDDNFGENWVSLDSMHPGATTLP